MSSLKEGGKQTNQGVGIKKSITGYANQLPCTQNIGGNVLALKKTHAGLGKIVNMGSFPHLPKPTHLHVPGQEKST